MSGISPNASPESLAPFPSAFRLKRRRLIGALFSGSGSRAGGRPKSPRNSQSEARTVARGVVRILYRVSDRASSGAGVPYQIGFSAPRRVKKAVDRNSIKRLLRVAFQRSKPRFDAIQWPSDQFVSILVLFRGDGITDRKATVSDALAAIDKLLIDLERLADDPRVGGAAQS